MFSKYLCCRQSAMSKCFKINSWRGVLFFWQSARFLNVWRDQMRMGRWGWGRKEGAVKKGGGDGGK